MATISKSNFDEDGLTISFTAAAGGGDEFANTGSEFLVIKNDDASSKTITVVAQTTTAVVGLGKVTKANRTIVVAAGGVAIAGPFPKAAYNDVDGFCQITYSAVTSLSIAVINKL